MTNDLLIEAIRESGLDLYEISEIAQVDPRTVQRWLGGRVPHPRYRQKVASALGLTPAELWPEAVSIRRQSDLEEIVGAWHRGDDADAVDWRALLRGAERQIDLLGYSLSRVVTFRGLGKQLAAKVEDGCVVRIAIADPDAEHVLAADLAQRPSGRLVPRIKVSREQLRGLGRGVEIECRQHRVATSHTVLRFDDHLLLTVHLHGAPGPDAPVLHLRRDRDYGIFDQLAKHFEDVWAEATPIESSGPQPEEKQPVRQSAADRMLDELDYVWRPER